MRASADLDRRLKEVDITRKAVDSRMIASNPTLLCTPNHICGHDVPCNHPHETAAVKQDSLSGSEDGVCLFQR